MQLCDDYKTGETTADTRYKNKDIQVQGAIRSVRKDNKTGEPMLELRGTTDSKSGSRSVRMLLRRRGGRRGFQVKKR